MIQFKLYYTIEQARFDEVDGNWINGNVNIRDWQTCLKLKNFVDHKYTEAA